MFSTSNLYIIRQTHVLWYHEYSWNISLRVFEIVELNHEFNYPRIKMFVKSCTNVSESTTIRNLKIKFTDSSKSTKFGAIGINQSHRHSRLLCETVHFRILFLIHDLISTTVHQVLCALSMNAMKHLASIVSSWLIQKFTDHPKYLTQWFSLLFHLFIFIVLSKNIWF